MIYRWESGIMKERRKLHRISSVSKIMISLEKSARFLERLASQMDDDESAVIEELAECILGGDDVPNPDECADVLLGYAEDADDDEQAMIYSIINYIQG
ncbi:MAG: hypothetical protein ACI4C1_08110 [Lachnospiraceae bacterium]